MIKSGNALSVALITKLFRRLIANLRTGLTGYYMFAAQKISSKKIIGYMLFAYVLGTGSIYSQKIPSWDKAVLPQSIANGYFLDVFFLPTNQQFGWACGFDGHIAITTDGGNVWNASIIQGKPFLESIHFVDSKHGFTSGPGGVYRTIDGGISWTNITSFTNMSQIWGCYFVDKDNGMYVGGGCNGSAQVFVRTTDGGNSWSVFESYENESGLADLILYDKNGLGYAVSSGLLWQTQNGGVSWNVFASIAGPRAWAEEITHFKSSFLTPFSGDDCFGGIRNYGGANFTTDNGKTWNQFTTNKSMFGSFLIDEKKGWICGDQAEVLYTSNSGKVWTKINCGLNNANIDDIWFVNDSLGWAAGQGIYKFSYIDLPVSFIKATPKPYCFGDTVKLSVSDDFENVIWNIGGNTGNSSFVTKNMTVIAKAFHKPTCRTISDTLIIEYNPPVQAQLNVGKDTVLCGNDDLIISVDGKYEELLWFDGDKANKRIFNKQTNPSGFYVDVFDSLKCSRRLNIPSITWSNAPTPLIKLAGKQILCNADSTQLMAPSGFVSYTWNTGETQPSIYVREAGRYYVRLIDSLGCEVFSDTITIEKVDLDNYLSASLSGKKILEFDSTVIGGNSCIELTFTNKNAISNYILDLPFIRRNIEFSMPMSQFPIFIKPLDSLKLNICFSPDSIGIWRDTIIFRDTCSSLIFPLIGYGKPFIADELTKCTIDVKTSIISNRFASAFDIRPHPFEGSGVLIAHQDIGIRSIELLDIYGRTYPMDIHRSTLDYNLNTNCPSGMYIPLIHTSFGIVQLHPLLIIR